MSESANTNFGITVISDRMVRHTSETQGDVVARVQRTREDATGREFDILYWHNWGAPNVPLVRVECREV